MDSSAQSVSERANRINYIVCLLDCCFCKYCNEIRLSFSLTYSLTYSITIYRMTAIVNHFCQTQSRLVFLPPSLSLISPPRSPSPRATEGGRATLKWQREGSPLGQHPSERRAGVRHASLPATLPSTHPPARPTHSNISTLQYSFLVTKLDRFTPACLPACLPAYHISAYVDARAACAALLAS